VSGRGTAVPRWGIALVVALVLEGVPLLREQPLKEALELLFALPGLWVGSWLGAHSVLKAMPTAGMARERGEIARSPSRGDSRRGGGRH